MSDENEFQITGVAVASTEPEMVTLPRPEPVAALPPPVRHAGEETAEKATKFLDNCTATLSAIGEAQTAVASDVAAMAMEMSGLARANLTAAGDGLTAMLHARTLSDAMEAQFGFARRSLDAMVQGSIRLGEIYLRLANDVAKPMTRPPTFA